MFFDPRPARKRPQLSLSERRVLLMLGDALATITAVLIALLIWTIVDRRRAFDFAFVVEQGYWFIVLPGLWLLLASANDFYDLRLAPGRMSRFVRLVTINMQLLVVYLIIFFLSPRDELPRLFILYYAAGSFLLIIVWRFGRPYLLNWATERRRAFVVGSDWAVPTIIEAIKEYAPHQYTLVGVIGDAEVTGSEVESVPVLGTGSNLYELAQQYGVVELIVANPCELTGAAFQGVMDGYRHGISIVPMPILYEQLTGRVPVEHVGKDWAIILPIETTSIFSPYPVLKRLLDIVLSAVGLFLFGLMAPFLFVIMQLDSPGPMFFRQVRVGRGGELFKVIKLRTMIPDAEKHTGAVFAGQNDPRITRVGRFLRKSRLDEVPQFWNVIRGEMSLVGPRPERPEFIDQLTESIPFYRARLAVKPGVTGWAQVRYRYGATIEDHLTKLQYDLYYIRHQSLLLDLQIALRTVGKMISFQGT